MAIGETVVASLERIGTWLGCTREVVERIRAQASLPLTRFNPWGSERAEPATPPPPRAESAGPETEAQEAKYYLGPPDVESRPRAATVRLADREAAELPRAYGHDRIVLLPRDPWWAFTYWEVTPTTRVQALRSLGAEAEGAREILRVYDVTFITFTGDNAWLSFDVELPPGNESWYLNVGRPAASYCVEIGLRTPTGRFLPLARSNVVTTPRAAPATDSTVQWVDLRHGVPQPTDAHWRGYRVPTGDEADGTAGGSGSSEVHAPPAR